MSVKINGYIDVSGFVKISKGELAPFNAIITGTVVDGVITSGIVVDGGLGYCPEPPHVLVVSPSYGPGGTFGSFTFDVDGNCVITNINIIDGGSGYLDGGSGLVYFTLAPPGEAPSPIDYTIVASDPEAGALFGSQISVNAEGNYLVAGAPEDGGTNAGAVYAYSSASPWSDLQKITGSVSGGLFGVSVDIASDDGDTMVIGAPTSSLSNPSGRAYVYTKSGAGAWSQAKVINQTNNYTVQFGGAVAISGDASTIIVGSSATSGGVEVLSGSNWNDVYELFPPLENTTTMGAAVDINTDGSRYIYSQPAINLYGAVGIGTASTSSEKYWQGSSFVQSQSGWNLGAAVAMSGDGLTVAFSAPQYVDPGPVAGHGIVYIFRYNSVNGNWNDQPQAIYSPLGSTGGNFGTSLSLNEEGTRLIAGTTATVLQGNQGYVYREYNEGVWTLMKVIDTDAGGAALPGAGVAIAKDTGLYAVSSPNDTSGQGKIYTEIEYDVGPNPPYGPPLPASVVISAVSAGGAITAVTVTEPGDGYAYPPLITLNGSSPNTNGEGAVLSANLTGSGELDSVTVLQGGDFYTTSPDSLLTVESSPGSSETAIVGMTLSTGAVASVAVGYGGEGYAFPPAITMSSKDGGSGFTATAVLGSGGTAGQVVSVTVNTGGTGYIDADEPTVEAPPGVQVPIQAQLTIDSVDGNGAITAMSITDPGSGYTERPFVLPAFGGGHIAGQGAVVIPTIVNGSVDSIVVAQAGENFTTTASSKLGVEVPPGTNGDNAWLAITVDGSGIIDSVTVAAGGGNYSFAPTVAFLDFSGVEGGSGAEITTTLGTGGTAGQVVGATIVNGGTGYTASYIALPEGPPGTPPVVAETLYIIPPVPVQNTSMDFATSVDVSDNGNLIVIGAPGDASIASYGGNVFVWSQTLGVDTWNRSTLIASTGSYYDQGSSVAISDDGTTIVAAAPGYYGVNSYTYGAAYVYTTANGGDTWNNVKTLLPTQTGSYDSYTYASYAIDFGKGVGISADGTTIIVGGEKNSTNVFSGSLWATAANVTQGQDSNGTSVAMNDAGTLAVIGKPTDDTLNSNAGQAFVFSSVDWTVAVDLLAAALPSNERFGNAVDMDATGDRIIVAAMGSTANALGGRVYIFKDGGGNSWASEDVISTPDGTADSTFGKSVSISNDAVTLLIGAPGGTVTNPGGAVYEYTRSGTSWTHTDTFAKSNGGTPGDNFGWSTAIDGTGVVSAFGARREDVSPDTDVGTAYIDGTGSGTGTAP